MKVYYDADADLNLITGKNIAIVGGLLFLAGMGAGQWSVESEEDRGRPGQPATSPI